MTNSSTDSNATSLSSGVACAIRYVSLNERTGGELPIDDSFEHLKRALSTTSIISTTSSFAERMENASRQPSRQDFRIIGRGSCGTVFEIPGTETAVKKGPGEQAMWTDYCLTNRMYNAVADTRATLQDHFPGLTIPRTPMAWGFYKDDHKEYWSANLARFPTSHRSKQAVFALTRILPLPQPTREALISKYFDPDPAIQDEAKDDVENKDCLVRVYLGDNKSDEQAANVYDSLRNFPLSLNMAEDLELHTINVAKEMALGLAIMHWRAEVNGMDVEFVLGSSATADAEAPRGCDDLDKPPPSCDMPFKPVGFRRRAVHLWMIDFDKASTIELISNDVAKKLVPAFLSNDPYYPRPSIDEELWTEFCETYLKASRLILQGKNVDPNIFDLPQQFLDGVSKGLKEQDKWNEMDNIVFA